MFRLFDNIRMLFLMVCLSLVYGGCSDKVEEFKKARVYEIQQMKKKSCAFCCDHGILVNDSLCSAMLSVQLANVCLGAAMPALGGDLEAISILQACKSGEPHPAIKTFLDEEDFDLTINEFFRTSKEMTIKCREADDEEACRIGCGGEVSYCWQPGMPTEEIPSEPNKCVKVSQKLVEQWQKEKKKLEKLLVAADETKRFVTGLGSIGMSDTLSTPTLIAYQGSYSNLITWQQLLNQEQSENRAKFLWQMALGKVADGLASVMDNDLFEVSSEAAELLETVAGSASDAAGLLQPAAVHNAAPALQSLGKNTRNLLVQIKAFKGYQSTSSAGFDRASAFFGGLTILASAAGDVGEFLHTDDLVKTGKFSLAMAMTVDALKSQASGQQMLGKVLAVWESISTLYIATSQDDLVIDLMKTAVKGIVLIQSGAIAAAVFTGGSSLVVATAAFVISAGANIAIDWAAEPSEYLRAYQLASLLYTVAFMIQAADDYDQMVSAAAINTANELMDKHVVGKVIPHIVNVQEWPIISDWFKKKGLAIEVPEGAEKAWRDYLDEYYGRWRLDLWIAAPVLWTSHEEGQLSESIEALVNCKLTPSNKEED